MGRHEKPRKKWNTSRKVLAVLGAFLLVFIVTMIVIFCVKGSVPDTLIQCVMGGGSIEAVAMAGIEISKVISGKDPGKGNDDEGTFV